MKTKFTITSKVWFYGGKAGWFFVTLPAEPSRTIRKNFSSFASAWGSLPVTATIGKTVWKTSIFPEKKTGAYVLPIKADVRRKEGVDEGDRIKYSVAIRFPKE